MKRITKFQLSFIVILFCFKAICQDTTTLNFVFFLVDDLGVMDVGYNGSVLYETPNIDILAQEGVVFNNAYAAYPRCVPSRYAMITGRFPGRDHIPGSATVKDVDYTVAEAFKDGGYVTYFAGKWHLSNDGNDPDDAGFDINIAGGEEGAPHSGYFYPYNLTNGLHDKYHDNDEPEFLTDRLTWETVDFINANKDNPFFVYLSHYAVHGPHQAKQDDIDFFTDKLLNLDFEGEEYIEHGTGVSKLKHDHPTYAAMVYSMDQSLGNIVQCLKDNDIYDNTVIIFTSDHGGVSNRGWNSRGLVTSHFPFRGGKGHLYEGGIRVPTVVRWPGVSESGTISKTVIHGTDYYPTMLDMAGLPLYPENHLDGKSFTWALKGTGNPYPNRILFWQNNGARPYSTGDMYSSVIMQGDYKLIDLYDMREVELYNIRIDSIEAINLANENPAIRDSLYKLLVDWRDLHNVNDNIHHDNPYYSLFKNDHFEYGSDFNWNLLLRNSANAALELTGKSYPNNDSPVRTTNKNACRVAVSNSTLNFSDVVLESDCYNYTFVSDSMEVSFFGKAESGSLNIKCMLDFTKNETKQTIISPEYTLGGSWSKYFYKFKLPFSGCANVKISFLCGNSIGNYVFDDLWVLPKGEIFVPEDECEEEYIDIIPPSVICAVSGNQPVDIGHSQTYTHGDDSWNGSATDNQTDVNNIIIRYYLFGATINEVSSLDGQTFNLGTTWVRHTATDEAGNIDSCSFTVTVNGDNTNNIFDNIDINPISYYLYNKVLTLYNLEQKETNICLYDLSGNKVLNEKAVNSENIDLNLSGLYNGIYIAQIIQNDIITSFKILLDN